MVYQYTDDNNDHMPVNTHIEPVYVNDGWVDKIFPYMGENLTQEVINQRSPGIKPGKDGATSYPLFNCPEHQYVETPHNSGHSVTTYGANGFIVGAGSGNVQARARGWIPHQFASNFDGKVLNSLKISEANSRSIAIAEGVESVLGSARENFIFIEDFQVEQANADFWLHDGYKLNWAFVDGSVSSYEFFADH